jgi:hypothetical protein
VEFPDGNASAFVFGPKIVYIRSCSLQTEYAQCISLTV